MKTILYFHGLGSSAASRKFVRLQQVFADRYHVICPEWTFTTDIRVLLANLLAQYEKHKSIIIIGSSTGANFAYQLTESLRSKAVKVNLILINPLLDFEQRISSRPFPAKLENYIRTISEVNECSLILSKHDEAIDHSLIQIGDKVNKIEIDDNHQVKNLKIFIRIIKELLKKKKSKVANYTSLLIKIRIK